MSMGIFVEFLGLVLQNIKSFTNPLLCTPDASNALDIGIK